MQRTEYTRELDLGANSADICGPCYKGSYGLSSIPSVLYHRAGQALDDMGQTDVPCRHGSRLNTK